MKSQIRNLLLENEMLYFNVINYFHTDTCESKIYMKKTRFKCEIHSQAWTLLLENEIYISML